MPEESHIKLTAVASSPPSALSDEAGRGSRRRARRVRRNAVAPAGERFFQPLPAWMWSTALVLAGWGSFTANPLLTPCAVLLVPVFASLLWFRGEPPVLLFACCMQWLQATAAVFYTNSYGIPLALQVEYGGADLARATWLSMIGVLVLAVGMRLALLRRGTEAAAQAHRESGLIRPVPVFLFYLAAFVFFFGVGWLANRTPALAQPLRALATLKWVLVFLLTHHVLTQRRRYLLLGIVVGLEFGSGILSFFSEFKNVFFILLVVLPSAHYLFKGWRLAQFSIVVAFVLLLCVVWTAIKADYRLYLNQGTGLQVVLVPVKERATKLGELVSGLSRAKIEEAFEDLILRVSYVKLFAFTLDNVPESIPHEKGKLWLESVKHVLMPRFLFPDKPAINDSDRTNHYSGVQVSTAEQGSSIGLGYMCESYIDFGPRGMFVPILLLGFFYGFIYRYFVNRYRLKLLGFALATSILVFGACTIETSNIKLVGGNLMGLLVLGAFAKVAGGWFWRLIATPMPAAMEPASVNATMRHTARRGRP